MKELSFFSRVFENQCWLHASSCQHPLEWLICNEAEAGTLLTKKARYIIISRYEVFFENQSWHIPRNLKIVLKTQFNELSSRKRVVFEDTTRGLCITKKKKKKNTHHFPKRMGFCARRSFVESWRGWSIQNELRNIGNSRLVMQSKELSSANRNPRRAKPILR